MKRNTLIEIIAALFILLFVYTAASKLFEFSSFRKVLSTSALIGNKAPVVAWALPLMEFGISLLLFASRTRRQGLWGAMLLVAGYLAYMLFLSSGFSANYAGVFRNMSWTQHLIFNIFFMLLAVLALWWDSKKPTAGSPSVIYRAMA